MIDDLLILNISVDIFNIYVHPENPDMACATLCYQTNINLALAYQ